MSLVKEQEAAIGKLAKMIVETPGPVCLVGPPGCGKTMAARMAATMAPLVDPVLARQASQIRCAMRLPELGFVERPFRAPHHTCSQVALVGSRPDPVTWFPHYGEMSLAHGGVLFLDELPEFSRLVLDAVVDAMQNKKVTHGTPIGNVTYPADFKLVAAMNPCPCGYSGHPTRKCGCSPESISRYLGRVRKILDSSTVIHVASDMRTVVEHLLIR